MDNSAVALESTGLKGLAAIPTGISHIRTDALRPTPENEVIYRDTLAGNEIHELVESVSREGVLQSLVISADNFILSGHRRWTAATLADIPFVPVEIRPIEVGNMKPDERMRILVEYNVGTRVKTQKECIAEAIAKVDPEEAIRRAQNRKAPNFTTSQKVYEMVEVGRGLNRRTDPRRARKPLYDAVIRILDDLRKKDLLPYTNRGIHYRLLGEAPMTSTYANAHPYGENKHDANYLSDLITDARSFNLIPDHWIIDPTRQTKTYKSQSVQEYVQDEIKQMFQGYYSDVHREQDNHVEIIIEKNTLFDLVSRKVAWPMRLPIHSARGFISIPVQAGIRQRFIRSAKKHLVIVYISDLDPEGVTMPGAFLKYFKHDQGITPTVIRAGVNPDQVKKYNIPVDTQAKKSSSNYDYYLKKYGTKDCWELDGLPPDVLIDEITQACKSVLDVDILNDALEEEKQMDVKLSHLQEVVSDFIQSEGLDLLED